MDEDDKRKARGTCAEARREAERRKGSVEGGGEGRGGSGEWGKQG